MSKGLEALKRISDNTNVVDYLIGQGGFEKDYHIIEQELKALQLIKEKCVVSFAKSNNADDFGETRYINNNYRKKVSDEEYDLLKEMITK